MDSLTGAIDRIVYHNDENGWTVARLVPDMAPTLFNAAPDVTTVVGPLPGVKAGETLDMTGEWQTHPQHGRNFRVSSFEPRLPTTVDGIRRYLGSGLIKGIGPKTAARIVDKFGENTLEIIENEPGRLHEVSGLAPKKVTDIRHAWAEQHEVKNVMLFLQTHDVSTSLAARIFKAYGADSINIIRGDPYQLAKDVQGIGFVTADTLAQKLGQSPQSPQRHAAGLKHVLTTATSDGHVYLPQPQLIAQAIELLHANADELQSAIARLTASKEVIIEPSPTSDGEPQPPHVYLAPFFFSEHGSAKRMRLLLETPSTLLFAQKIDWNDMLNGFESAGSTSRGHVQLAAGQRAAVQAALSNKVSVLTGGPGVGKTTTLKTILNVLDLYHILYSLAAPTGRAAKRMSEATGRRASTLHRLLEYTPVNNSCGFNEDNPLPCSFVILDESSMVDIIMFYNLLRAIPLTGHLLLVGDADQLPSVGPGNVLRDLISSGVIPVTYLTELFRQAATSHIITTAHAVNRGEVPSFQRDGQSDLFFISEGNPSRVLELVKTVVSERAPRAFGLDPISDVQVISPTNRGPLGVETLNSELQQLLNPNSVNELPNKNRLFRIGDKVMQTTNDYSKNIFNGDIGRILSINHTDKTLIVEFPAEGIPMIRASSSPPPPLSSGGFVQVPYQFSEVEELTHAYAITVHKSQGGEFPCVVLPLASSHHLLLQRNLLYTAITRARRLCVIVGSPRALATAVHNNAVAQRFTALDERLRSLRIREIR